MLGRAAERFIRTRWTSIDDFAQECYAIFSPDAPIQASSIIINQAAGNTAPPFVVNRQPGATGPSIQVNTNGGTNNFGNIDVNGSNYGPTNFNINEDHGTFNFPANVYNGTTPGSSLDFKGQTFNFADPSNPGSGGGGGSGSGGSGTGGIDLGTINFPGQDPSTVILAVPNPQFNPFVLYGEVQAQGSGISYAVKVWAKSPLLNAPPIGIIDVAFPAVDPSEMIPAGTPCPVICFPGLDGTTSKILSAIGFVPTFF